MNGEIAVYWEVSRLNPMQQANVGRIYAEDVNAAAVFTAINGDDRNVSTTLTTLSPDVKLLLFVQNGVPFVFMLERKGDAK